MRMSLGDVRTRRFNLACVRADSTQMLRLQRLPPDITCHSTLQALKYTLCTLCSISFMIMFLLDYPTLRSSYISLSRFDVVSLYTHVVATMFCSLIIDLDSPPNYSALPLPSLQDPLPVRFAYADLTAILSGKFPFGQVRGTRRNATSDDFP